MSPEQSPERCPRCEGTGAILYRSKSVLRHWFDEDWKYHTSICESCWGTGRKMPAWCSMDAVIAMAVVFLVLGVAFGPIIWGYFH